MMRLISSSYTQLEHKTYLPEPQNLRRFVGAVLQSRVVAPIVDINARDATNDQFQFAFIEGSQQMTWYQLTET